MTRSWGGGEYNNNNTSKYRPITSLCTIYKIYTACIAGKICKHLETNKLLAEQKGCIKNSQDCKEQLITDLVVLEQAHKDNQNMYIAYIDYRRAFDSATQLAYTHITNIQNRPTDN